MKRITGLAISAILMFACCFTVFGVNIDGNNQGTEWDGATAYKLFSGDSNSSVNFGAVKVKFAPDEYAIYLCFTFLDPNLEQGNTMAGISLSVENSPPYVLTMENSPYNIDVDRYEVSGAMYTDENNGGTCEIRIGMKYGVPKETSCSVRFIDYLGIPSNIYNFTLVNESYTETTEMHFAPTEDNSDPAYNPGLLTEEESKTTKSKTTTERTTKETITKATTTKSKTTKPVKTTKPEKKTQAPSPSVYVYEKEIIISQVVVTVPVSITEATTTQTETYSETQTTRINISEGSKYKSIASVICATAFITIAAWGAVGIKKKNTEEENAE